MAVVRPARRRCVPVRLTEIPLERRFQPRLLGSSVTGAQQRVLDGLRELSVDGWPVPVRTIGTYVGLSSPATVHHLLVALERLGLAERRGRRGWRPCQGVVA